MSASGSLEADYCFPNYSPGPCPERPPCRCCFAGGTGSVRQERPRTRNRAQVQGALGASETRSGAAQARPAGWRALAVRSRVKPGFPPRTRGVGLLNPGLPDGCPMTGTPSPGPPACSVSQLLSITDGSGLCGGVLFGNRGSAPSSACLYKCFSSTFLFLDESLRVSSRR